MSSYSTETVSGLTGVMPATLRNWRRAGLITTADSKGSYSSGQLTRIRTVQGLTASGSTLREIHAYLCGREPKPFDSWECRQEEMHTQLRNPSDSALFGLMRQMGSDYCGDDFVNAYLKPLNLWLRADVSDGADTRQKRFHDVVVLHAKSVMSASTRRKSVPVFLEAVSVADKTEIWMEAIRLTGQGCRVELCESLTGYPSTALHHHEHHLMWCGAGITQLMQWNFREKLRNDRPVRLCGPDQLIRTAA